MLVRSSRVLLVSVLVLMVALVAPRGKAGATTTVGPKAYYLALGDSLAYGYQPDFDWSHGYANDLYKNLQGHGTMSLTNMACIGETSTTFIKGGCPYAYLRKTFYTKPQLQAAVDFINNHAGEVSPVTLDIGANDMLPLITITKTPTRTTCTVSQSWQTTLNTFDTNFKSILSQLTNALKGQGDLLVMNYYDPYQNLCPNTIPYLDPTLSDSFNAHIKTDANAYNVQVADVFTPFSGNICSYTWMCSSYQDIHPMTLGYTVIAGAYEFTAGY
jgi:lysophospholipase L1-like esterase